ncbi:MAG: hypothetical protein GY940_15785, partial [bacterium]|nr:hypothetical protein [bacterium]
MGGWEDGKKIEESDGNKENDENQVYIIREFEPLERFQLPYLDMSRYISGAQGELLHRIRKRITARIRVFDHLLFRVMVLKWDQQRYTVIFSINHLIFDGESGRILPQKMTDIYNRQIIRETNTTVTEPQPDYHDYCEFIGGIDYSQVHFERYLDLEHYQSSVKSVSSSFQAGTVRHGGFEI